MTFTDEVLDRAWQARIEREAEVRDQLSLDSAAESAEANAAGLAAMRAVLEGHLAAQAVPDECDCGQPSMDVDEHADDCGFRLEHRLRSAASDGSPR